MYKFIITGMYGGSNLGDDALLSSIVGALKRNYKDISITAISHNPEQTIRFNDVMAVKQLKISRNILIDLYEVITTIKSSNCVIVGGGGLLQDEFKLLTIPRYLIPALIGKMFRKRVVLYSLGAGPINTFYSKVFLKLACRQMDIITVRDEESKRLLLNIGIKNVSVNPDPAILLPHGNKKRTNEIFENEGVDLTERPKICIALRGFYHTGLGFRSLKNLSNDEQEYFVNAINKLYDASNALFVFLLADPSGDKRISTQIQKKLKCNSVIIKGYYSPIEYSGILSEMDLLISMPLHPLIISSNHAIPLVAIDYNAKVRYFMRLLNQEEFVVPIERLKNLETISCKVWKNRNSISNEISSANRILQQKTEESIRAIFDNRKGISDRNIVLLLISFLLIFFGVMLGYFKNLLK